MRSLGHLAMPGIEGRPSVTRAHAEQRTPGVDSWCDVEVGFPGGATGLAAHSMVSDHRSFTIRIVGTAGDLDDRLTMNTPAGTCVERLGTRASYTYQLEAFAACGEHGATLPFGTADAWRTWPSSTVHTERRRFPGSSLRRQRTVSLRAAVCCAWSAGAWRSARATAGAAASPGGARGRTGSTGHARPTCAPLVRDRCPRVDCAVPVAIVCGGARHHTASRR